MKIFSLSHTFNYPWEYVSAANWRKYPNEMSTQVVAVDVLRREVDNRILRTERLITCEQSIPAWIDCLVGGLKRSYVREVSEVDLDKRTVTMRLCNMTMSLLLKVYETVVYSPDGDKTKFTQEAQITAFGAWRAVCSKIEQWSVDRFDFNAKRGKIGFESVLEKLLQLEAKETQA